jgi:hypothetical protein
MQAIIARRRRGNYVLQHAPSRITPQSAYDPVDSAAEAVRPGDQYVSSRRNEQAFRYTDWPSIS